MLTLTDIRASNTVLVTEFGGVRAVHFCLSTPRYLAAFHHF
ncbi:hypothetical protein I2562_003189 [Escherichia coli]